MNEPDDRMIAIYFAIALLIGFLLVILLMVLRGNW